MAEPDEGAPVVTPLVLFWTFTTLFWSIFTHPTRTFAARVLLFQPAWLIRTIVFNDSTWVQDLLLFLGSHALYGLWSGAWALMTVSEITEWVNLNDSTLQVYLQVFALLGGCAGLAGTVVYRGSRLDSSERDGPIHEQRIDESLLDPLLITSRTAHSRMFPAKHTFSYSYLLVGIPVGFQGRIGDVLSVDSPKRAWFDVKSSDYLNRGGVFLGLGEKLKRFLHSQGVTDRDYAFAYLVTAPRFVGYSFNPVSFWYIYDSDVKLKYMILEVNNTFDERRMYLLRADSSKLHSSDLTSQIDGEPAHSSKGGVVFTNTFEKDFHVSPFNSRKGSYSLRAVDPLAAYQETGQVKIDNTITLRSSKDNAKIVARVWSEGAPRQPSHVSSSELVKFIIAWWWVGLMTFPRIVWEAQKLFFRKKLHVWFKPEVNTNSIGRKYTEDEALLEYCFHNFLTHVVEHSRRPLRVIYEPAQSSDGSSHNEEIVLYSPGFTYEEDKSRTLTVKVLSPAFYSRFVHYAHAKEAFDRECLATDDKNRTVVVEPADVLPALLEAIRDADRSPDVEGAGRSILGRIRWSLLRRLRCPPAAASYPSDSSRLDHEYTIQDIRTFQLSELDRHVRAHGDEADAYRRTVAKLFLAERLVFGIPPLIVFCDLILRSSLLLVAMVYCDHAKVFDILRPRPFKRSDLVPSGLAVVLANWVHIWSLFKG